MAFSDGFNNTFRSLDNSFQWRNAQKENARQFDATLDETKRVNDSRIDVNSAQIGRLKALTNQVDQLVDYNEQANPKRLDLMDAQLTGQKAQNTFREHQNDAAAYANQKTEATLKSDIAATNATNVRKRVDEQIALAENRGAHATDILKMFRNDDGSPMDAMTIASDPSLAARFISVASASDAIFDDKGFGKNSIGGLIPDYDENGKLWYYAVQEDAGEDGKGTPLRPDPDMVDANGEPIRLSPEEVAQAIELSREKLDTHASLGARGGDARQRVIGARAEQYATEQAGPGPQVVPTPGVYGRSIEDVRAEGQALEAELAELQAQREALDAKAPSGQRSLSRSNAGRTFPDVAVLTPEEKAQKAELDARAQQLSAQLGEIQTSLKAMGQNETFVERHNQWEQGIRTLAGKYTSRINQGETLNDGNYTTEQMDNLMATNNPEVTEQEMIDAQREIEEDFYKDIPDLAAFNGVADNGKPYEQGLSNTVGAELAQQIKYLQDDGDPYVTHMMKSDAGRNALKMASRRAVQATNGGRLPVVFSAELTKALESVSANDVGRVSEFALGGLGAKLKNVDPTVVEAVHIATAAELSARDSRDPLTQDEAEALAGRVLTRLRLGR